jgi:CubicO group peptidase (beta-lactamase class C family)
VLFGLIGGSVAGETYSPSPVGFGSVIAELDLSPVVELLRRQRAAGWHSGAQCYVSCHGEVLLDVAEGESRPGRELRTDDLMLWYSSGKPLTTVAVLQLWERGQLDLDDPVGRYVEGWGAGKERATIRHVLTHTGGFPMYRDTLFDEDLTYAESVARIAAHPAEWEPGTAAGYHPVTGWKVLGAIVERVDGRTIDAYVRDEVCRPLGLATTRLGIPLDEQRELGERIVPVEWRGHTFPVVDPDGGLRMAPYHIEEIHNEPWHIAKVEPGGGTRGPARELGRFYESLLGYGPAILGPQTVDTMTAVHRWGLRDALFAFDAPWGLGVAVDFSGGTGRRAFGHGGMASSRGLADPECGLVVVVVANGLGSFFDAEQRVLDVTDAAYSALGDSVAHVRRPVDRMGRPPMLST